MSTHLASAKSGFSLVEVCLAVLVVGLGLLSVFSLFPTGLAASDAAVADTETGLFAEQVLNGIQSHTNTWTDWQDPLNFEISGVKISEGALKDEIAYYISIGTATSRLQKVREVILYCMPCKDMPLPTTNVIAAKGSRFYTELFYMELP
jgi:Tfp pilus assembly protein PilV